MQNVVAINSNQKYQKLGQGKVNRQSTVNYSLENIYKQK